MGGAKARLASTKLCTEAHGCRLLSVCSHNRAVVDVSAAVSVDEIGSVRSVPEEMAGYQTQLIRGNVHEVNRCGWPGLYLLFLKLQFQ